MSFSFRPFVGLEAARGATLSSYADWHRLNQVYRLCTGIAAVRPYATHLADHAVHEAQSPYVTSVECPMRISHKPDLLSFLGAELGGSHCT